MLSSRIIDQGEPLDIIEWSDSGREMLSFRFPDDDKSIQRGAQLIVRDSQVAQLVYLGQFGDTFGPGRRRLTSDTIPILSRLRSWNYGFESPFKADVYFVTTHRHAGIAWSTSHPIMLRDADLGIVRARAFGIYDFRIVDPRAFLHEVAGFDRDFRLQDIEGTMRSRIVRVFSEALGDANIPLPDTALRCAELGEALLPLINRATLARYGMEISRFVIENVSVTPEVGETIHARSNRTAIGDLSDYVRDQMGRRMGLAPEPLRASRRSDPRSGGGDLGTLP